jgi:hypothetical protein
MGEFELIGGVGIMGFISPMDTEDTYAVIDPIYGIDGLRNVNTLNDLNSISFERRRSGMIVGVNGGETYYKLKNIEWTFELTDWSELDFNKVFNSDKETPLGVIDNINRVFTLEHTPITNSEHIYLNGVLQDSGEDNDYVIEDNQIIFLIPPRINMKIKCSYRYR